MFPQDTDFIEQGLEIGMHLISRICLWTQSAFRYGDGTKHYWSIYKDQLHEYLDFKTDCRFHKLEYQPSLDETLYGLEKIGMMGVLSKMQPKQWKWNPVDIQVNPDFLEDYEKPEEKDTFILEYLQKSIEERIKFFQQQERRSGLRYCGGKRRTLGGSFQPSKR